MSDSLFNARIPQPPVPFLDTAGGISREWLYFMVAILNRTGGNAGISSGSLQEQIMSAVVFSASINDTPNAPAPLLMAADLLGGDAPPAPSDPILAALMVSP
jgi:hypothetical protein